MYCAASPYPVMLRWAVIGTVAALALFLIGLWNRHPDTLECDGLLGIERGKPFDHGDTAEFLVGRHEY